MNPTFFQFSAVIGQRVVYVSRNPIPKGIARENGGGQSKRLACHIYEAYPSRYA